MARPTDRCPPCAVLRPLKVDVDHPVGESVPGDESPARPRVRAVGPRRRSAAALARRKHVAHTSKTPGRTQLLNCFRVGATTGATATATLVDCPGYGYAAVSKATRGSWQKMIERYLLEREPLTMAMLLVDGEIGPTKLDLEVLDWLRANTVPHSVVATKHDKVKSSKRDRRRRDLATLCMLEPADVLWVSAAKSTGVDRLRDVVRLWLSLG